MTLDPDNMTQAEIDQMWAAAHVWRENYRKQSAGRVYALAAGDFIKIGFTKGDILIRIAKLQTGCPTKLRLIGTGPGGRLIENRLHALLRPYRSHGEWYRSEPIVRELIARFVPTSPWDS